MSDVRHADNQFLIAPYLSLIVLMSACSIFSGAGSSSLAIPIPTAGQWVDFGRNEPTIRSGAFTFPGPSGVAGYFYTKPPATIAQGQTVTLVYSINGSAPEWGVSDPTDVRHDFSASIRCVPLMRCNWRGLRGRRMAQPASLEMVTLDDRLANAARKEGLRCSM